MLVQVSMSRDQYEFEYRSERRSEDSYEYALTYFKGSTGSWPIHSETRPPAYPNKEQLGCVLFR